MHQNRLCMEEYIDFIVGYSKVVPYEVTVDDIEYRVYFTRDREIRIPLDATFEISGNNVNGFIVTMWN